MIFPAEGERVFLKGNVYVKPGFEIISGGAVQFRVSNGRVPICSRSFREDGRFQSAAPLSSLSETLEKLVLVRLILWLGTIQFV